MPEIDTLEKLVETLHPEREAHPFVAPRIFALIGTPETSAQPVEPGQRRECIVGDRVRFFVAGAANQTRWTMLRAPAAHTGGITSAGDWTPTAPGLYLVAIELDGSESWKAEQAERARRANEARAERAREQHTTSNPRAGEKSGVASNDAGPERNHAAEAKAKTTAAIALDGWSRVLAFVALPADAATELPSTKGRRGAEWRHVFRGVLRDPRCTDENITRSLENVAPSWRTLLGTSGIDLRHFGA